MTPAQGESGKSQRGRRPVRPVSGRDPTFHQLRLFLVLAEERHFGRAAARMHLSQPAFSKQIRALEETLEVRLAERGRGDFRLTAAGRALAPLARTALGARSAMRALAGRGMPQRVRLGAVGGEAAMPYVQAVLGALRARHPGIEVQWRSVNFVEQVEALRDGTLDAAFLRPPLPPDLASVTVARELRVVCCLPADDPCASRGSVSLADLAEHTVVDVPPQVPRAWWRYWTVDPRPDGSPVRYGAPVSDMEALLLAVAQQRVIAFLPAAARTLYPRPGLAYVDVTDAPTAEAALAWPADKNHTPVVAALRDAASGIRMASSAGGETGGRGRGNPDG